MGIIWGMDIFGKEKALGSKENNSFFEGGKAKYGRWGLREPNNVVIVIRRVCSVGSRAIMCRTVGSFYIIKNKMEKRYPRKKSSPYADVAP